MNKRIALIYGGASSEHEVSVKGYEYLKKLLNGTNYALTPVLIDKNGEWLIDSNGTHVSVYPTRDMGGGLSCPDGFLKIDVAIPLLHGEGGEDGKVQGALDCANIPYIGADICTGAVCLDKSYAKAIAESLGIPTARGVSLTRCRNTETALAECLKKLGFPMFMKPRRLGSSVGAHPIKDENEFRLYYPMTYEAGDGLVLVEEAIEKKRELECAFAEINGKRIITPPGEILNDGFYGYDEKYGGKTVTVSRADIDEATASVIADYAERLAQAFILRHLARIDFFLSGGKVIFNEINTFPGFTSESLYPKMLSEYGIEPRDAILSFVEEALSW